MIIGITAGIGSGKSVVSRILRTKGFYVYDCDYEAKVIMDCSSELKSEIATRLGEECLVEDCLDRKKIAQKVFGDENHRLWLNSRVHKLVKDDFLGKIRDLDHKIVFVESAILKSSGLASLCDMIWIVEADPDLRIKRASGRDGCDEASIKQRMEAQKDEYDDFGDIPLCVVYNNENSLLLPRIDEILKQLI